MQRKLGEIPLHVKASLLFGLKTYLVYRFLFTIHLENFRQEFILLINPFVSAFLFLGLSVWFNRKTTRLRYIRYTVLIGTLIIYFNLVFYRSFTDFLTIPQLFQTSNIADLGSSILSLIKWYDIFLFVDVVILWSLTKILDERSIKLYSRPKKAFVLLCSLILLAGNFLIAEIERPQLLTRGFDREYLVKNIGIFHYHIYDIFVHSKVKTQRVLADGNELPTIVDYIEENIRSKEQSSLFGVAEGKNIIFISAESLQTFVIGEKVNGEVITPFLNQLVKDPDTYYFTNFYHQTEQGKTSDSEFIVENSLYPSPRGAVFFTHAQNEYHAMPEILKTKDYKSYVFHANNTSFWNRDQMYESLDFDYFFGKDAYEVTEDNRTTWGLKDKEFFRQSMKYLIGLDEPFYAKFITLTNHFPFELDEEDRSIEPYDSNSNTLNNYFPTVRYMDEAIELFFQYLKDVDLYDDSVIIIMGDHDGISANHNQAMSMYLEKEEITPYDYFKLQRVPLFIHIPGHGKGEVVEKISGQIDLKPTILHMVGIETDHDIYFGNDLFHDDRKEFIAFRNGDFITDELLYTSGICYKGETGEVLGIESEEIDGETPCSLVKEKVVKELEYSDGIIYGDLFRFHDFGK